MIMEEVVSQYFDNNVVYNVVNMVIYHLLLQCSDKQYPTS